MLMLKTCLKAVSEPKYKGDSGLTDTFLEIGVKKKKKKKSLEMENSPYERDQEE